METKHYHFEINDHTIAIKFINLLCESGYQYGVLGTSFSVWSILTDCTEEDYRKLEYVISVTPEFTENIKAEEVYFQ